MTEGEPMSSECSISGHDLQPLSAEQKQKVEKRLSRRQRNVLVHKHAEPAFSGMTANGFRFNTTLQGTYVCVLGGMPVFHSQHKVEKGLGYATFTQPIDPAHVSDNLVMLGMPYAEGAPGVAVHNQLLVPAARRPGALWVEVTDTRASAHLGYKIDTADGSSVYCINAAALHFVPLGMEIPTKAWRYNTEGADLNNGEVGGEEESNPLKVAESMAWNLKYSDKTSKRIEFL